MQVIHSHSGSSSVHMQKDREFLDAIKGTPLLHIYEWDGPAITYGHFIDIEKHIDIALVQSLDVSYAKRPTGGGVLFHEKDVSFSLFIPSTHKAYSSETMANYYWINSCTKEAIQEFLSEKKVFLTKQCAYEKTNPYKNFCYATPTKYDLVMNGKKVGGAAERNTRQGLLHQASIFFTRPSFDLIEQLVFDKKAVERMKKESSPILEEPLTTEERGRFLEILRVVFTRYLM